MSSFLKNFKLNINDEDKSNSEEMNEQDGSSNSSSNSDQSIDDKHRFKSTNYAFLILLSLLLTCVRKIKFTDNKLIALDLISTFSKYLDDSIKLDRKLPYHTALLGDHQYPIVKSHAIYALNDYITSINYLHLQNINIFSEIIFDILQTFSKDEPLLVRSMIAKTISSFAITSIKYLDHRYLIKRSLLSNNDNNVWFSIRR